MFEEDDPLGNISDVEWLDNIDEEILDDSQGSEPPTSATLVAKSPTPSSEVPGDISLEEQLNSLSKEVLEFQNEVEQRQNLHRRRLKYELIQHTEKYSTQNTPSRQEVAQLKRLIEDVVQCLEVVSFDRTLEEKMQEKLAKLCKETEEVEKDLEKVKAKLEEMKPKSFRNVSESMLSGTCIFCNSDKHKARCCGEYDNAEERREVLEMRKICICCLQKGHEKDTCPNAEKFKLCKFCRQGKHHPSVCLEHSKKKLVAERIAARKKSHRDAYEEWRKDKNLKH